MRLAHLHITRTIPFSYATRLQSVLVRRLLAHKQAEAASAAVPSPDPIILTFTPHPVYTTGRRDLPASFTSADSDADAEPDHTQPAIPSSPSSSISSYLPPPLANSAARHLLLTGGATYAPTLRGGQTTYHGPGQLVAYAIADLRALRLGARSHVALLEDSVLELLAGVGVRGGRTADPGVWVADECGERDERDEQRRGWGQEREGGLELEQKLGQARPHADAKPKKIAAVGVRLRRFISSYGVGLNVTDAPLPFFRLIVPCGLEGREATSMASQGVDMRRLLASAGPRSSATMSGAFADEARIEEEVMREVGRRFAGAFAERVNKGFAEGGGIEDVYVMTEESVLD